MAIALRHAIPAGGPGGRNGTGERGQTGQTAECCGLCGCANLSLDYWDDPLGAASLQLCRCPRCDHRWTRALATVQPRATAPWKRLAPLSAISSETSSESAAA
jgi:hypothetical protein